MGVSHKLFRFTVLPAIVAVAFTGVSAQKRAAVPANPDDKTIVHVLNRLGFGPAPGDVERVRKIGLAAYIDQQLHPDRLKDESIDARLARFETLTMSSREMAE
jgi:hypothetical protein